MPEPEPVEPTKGASLADHVQIGFSYRMHFEGAWHKVRLSHISPGRTFFVFTRGKDHPHASSMTARSAYPRSLIGSEQSAGRTRRRCWRICSTISMRPADSRC